MAVQISPVQKKQKQTSVEANPLGQLLTVGGAVAGGVLGAAAGGVGAVPGAAAGAGLGQMLGGVVAPPIQTTSGGETMPVTPNVASDSISRRMSELNQGSENSAQIASSINSLKYIQDEDLRLKVAQPLVQAGIMASKAEGQV